MYYTDNNIQYLDDIYKIHFEFNHISVFPYICQPSKRSLFCTLNNHNPLACYLNSSQNCSSNVQTFSHVYVKVFYIWFLSNHTRRYTGICLFWRIEAATAQRWRGFICTAPCTVQKYMSNNVDKGAAGFITNCLFVLQHCGSLAADTWTCINQQWNKAEEKKMCVFNSTSGNYSLQHFHLNVLSFFLFLFHNSTRSISSTGHVCHRRSYF